MQSNSYLSRVAILCEIMSYTSYLCAGAQGAVPQTSGGATPGEGTSLQKPAQLLGESAGQQGLTGKPVIIL